MSMKIRSHHVVASLCVALLIGACATKPVARPEVEGTYLARYDLEVRDGSRKSHFKSQAFLDEDESTIFGANPSYVKLQVQPVSDSEYDVRISIAPTMDVSQQVQLTRSFRGRFGAPLELLADNRQLALKGTLAILRSK